MYVHVYVYVYVCICICITYIHIYILTHPDTQTHTHQGRTDTKQGGETEEEGQLEQPGTFVITHVINACRGEGVVVGGVSQRYIQRTPFGACVPRVRMPCAPYMLSL